ncbi:MAG: hypothetical protein KDA64_10040 [Rhodospirillaceae bacterium]|nr:hypothetical protein [Rhodospirillaceae bacterium]
MSKDDLPRRFIWGIYRHVRIQKMVGYEYISLGVRLIAFLQAIRAGAGWRPAQAARS